MNPRVTIALPTAEAFLSLRREVDWGEPSLAAAEAALEASLCGVITTLSNKTIGMARVIGDGALNLYIQDVIVTQDQRGNGIGRAMINYVIAHLQTIYPEDCTIGLMAAVGQAPFYEKFGFTARPTTTLGPGMQARLSDLANAQTSA